MTLQEADELTALIQAATQATRALERLMARRDPGWEAASETEMAARAVLFRWIGAHTVVDEEPRLSGSLRALQELHKQRGGGDKAFDRMINDTAALFLRQAREQP